MGIVNSAQIVGEKPAPITQVVEQITNVTNVTNVNNTYNNNFPFNNKVAVLGDSRTAAVSTATAGIENLGYMFWARVISEQRVYFDHSLNFGVGGDTTLMMTARIDAVIASGAGMCVVLGGTNDRTSSSGITLQQSIDAMETIISRLTAAGIWVILIAELPRGSSTYPAKALTSGSLLSHLGFRSWLLRQTGRKLVRVVDCYPDLLDGTAALNNLGYVKDTLTLDGLHPNTLGHKTIGTKLAPVFRQLIPDAPPLVPLSNAGLYDPVYNVYGWLNSNPKVTGTGGTLGTGGSGSLAAGFSAAASSGATGITRTYSKTAEDWQQCVFNGKPTSPSSYFDVLRLVSQQGLVPAGRKIEVIAEVVLQSGFANVMALKCGVQAVVNGTDSSYEWDGDQYQGTEVLPAGEYNYVLRSPPLTMPANATDLRIRLSVYVVDGVTCSGTVIVKSFGWRFCD